MKILLLLLLLFSCTRSKTFYKDFLNQALNNNPIFISSGSVPGEYDFLVEIPGGSPNKYEFRTATGQILLDRIICPRNVLGTDKWIHSFPANYGISPGLFNEDGDPLDLLVLGNRKTYKKMILDKLVKPRKVRIIGTLLMEECDKVPCMENDWIQDWKILAVDKDDPSYKLIQTTKDLPAGKKRELAQFFSNYKGARKHKKNNYPLTRVAGFFEKEKTLPLIQSKFESMDPAKREKEIKNCHTIFESKLRKKAKKDKFDKKYLKCLQRVYYKHFLPNSPHFPFYLRYNAYQILLYLGEDAKFKNAFKLMKKRRKEKKTYYRYVSFDSPSPGTKSPIFEWVKTLNRNKGCPPGFPQQHYKANKLISIKI